MKGKAREDMEGRGRGGKTKGGNENRNDVRRFGCKERMNDGKETKFL